MARTLRVLCLLFSTLTLGLRVHAQTEEQAKKAEVEPDYLALADAPTFLPRSYLYWGTPVGPKEHRRPLVFALTYALHLPIYSNLRDQALHGKHWAGAATLSFEGDLRMLAIRSSPVRMPSYRPNISGQLFYILHHEKAPTLFGFRLSLFHYSNGQERCAYSEEVRDDTAECEALLRSTDDPVSSLNRRNGNFSMNGWLFSAHARVHELNSHRVAIGQLALGLTASGNLPYGAGKMDSATRRLYGWGKLTAELDARRRFGWAAMGARAAVDYYPNSGPNVPPVAGLVEGIIGPYWLTGFGFFARYVGGRDPYNAFFVDKLQQFIAGLSWDGERPLKFDEKKDVHGAEAKAAADAEAERDQPAEDEPKRSWEVGN